MYRPFSVYSIKLNSFKFIHVPKKHYKSIINVYINLGIHIGNRANCLEAFCTSIHNKHSQRLHIGVCARGKCLQEVADPKLSSVRHVLSFYNVISAWPAAIDMQRWYAASVYVCYVNMYSTFDAELQTSQRTRRQLKCEWGRGGGPRGGREGGSGSFVVFLWVFS